MRTMTTETYNGWKNYPTWNVALWLDNDAEISSATQQLVEDSREVAAMAPQVADGIWTPEQAIRYYLADSLKSWVTDELAPDLGASFAADLLGFALDHVDWEEIASSLIDKD